jgi:hypothetical protein
MLAQHDVGDLEFVTSFEPTVSVSVDGLGPTLFCHGSPRSDEEFLSLRRTEYDVDEAIARIHASAYPRADEMVEILAEPPTPAQMIEQLEFSG